jgi:hypothetical protein
MWNAWTAPPGALPRDYDPWSCEAHCARCGELAQDCHCDEDEDMKQTLSAYMAGVSEVDEARCDGWMAEGDELRAAVGWRVFQGKAGVMAAVTGVPEDAIKAFVETGEISDAHRRTLEAMRG